MRAKRKNSVKILIAIILAVAVIALSNIITAPPNLHPSKVSISTPLNQVNVSKYSIFMDPMGSNTTFQIGGPHASSSYIAWINGPTNYVGSGNNFGVQVYLMQTSQNVTSLFTGSSINVIHARYIPNRGNTVTSYSETAYPGSVGDSGITISFNDLSNVNTTSTATVNITLVEESIIGPFHIWGQQKNISLSLEFNMTR
ncbi:hypothetical protein IX51_06920 [uncultured archaeon]|nr:hypothetical protein IX51_06920 [uncultured archaeon]